MVRRQGGVLQTRDWQLDIQVDDAPVENLERAGEAARE